MASPRATSPATEAAVNGADALPAAGTKRPREGSESPTKRIPREIRLSPAVDLSTATFRINAPPTDRPVRIYCDGIYDMFHYGHAKSLEQAKKAFAEVYLLVGVCNDAETHARKGKTVMADIERYESVRHCKWVDEVVPDAPWIVTQEFLDKHQIDYVAHDDIPYGSGDVADVYAFVKAQGRFLPTRRTEGISTSDLITRIVRDYDEYLRRNLARGVSPKDLNIGFFKEKRLQVAQSVQDIKDEIKTEIQEWRDEWRETVSTWEHRSQQYVKGFVELFKNGVKLLRIRSPIGSAPASPTTEPTDLPFHSDPDSGGEDDEISTDQASSVSSQPASRKKPPKRQRTA